MQHKYKISAFFIVLMAVIIAWLVGNHADRREKEPIKVGLVTTLTGPASSAGIFTRNGALLAIEQVNERGGVNGRQVEAIIRDDKADPDEALRVDKELINEGVVAFLGHYLSSVSTKIVPFMNENNMLMLSLGAATGDLSGLDDHFIRITLPNNIRTPIAARETYERLGVRNVAIASDLYNAAYTQSALKIYSAEFERLGGKILTVANFNSKENFDAPEIAKQLLSTDPEGVYVIADALHGAMLCQHLRKIKPSIKIIACAWAACVPEFILNGGRAVDGVLSVVESDDNSTNPHYLSFKKAYLERFGQPPGQHARDAYAITSMLLETLEKTTAPENMKEEFLNQEFSEGILGTIGVDQYGEPIRPVYVTQIVNGRMQVISTLNSVIVEE